MTETDSARTEPVIARETVESSKVRLVTIGLSFRSSNAENRHHSGNLGSVTSRSARPQPVQFGLLHTDDFAMTLGSGLAILLLFEFAKRVFNPFVVRGSQTRQ
jgi:hypothetical protein